MNYKLINDPKGGDPESVYLLDDNGIAQACISFNSGSRFYQEYLEWLAEGNEPLPADPIE